jgi:hypothetical protein
VFQEEGKKTMVNLSEADLVLKILKAMKKVNDFVSL